MFDKGTTNHMIMLNNILFYECIQFDHFSMNTVIVCCLCAFVQTVLNATGQCGSNQLVHITEEEYNNLFSPTAEWLPGNGIECVYVCLKGEFSIKMALYDHTNKICSCINRTVDTVSETVGTKAVYAVDLNRPPGTVEIIQRDC